VTTDPASGAGTVTTPPARPRHLKASYLAPGEALLRESLGTPWFYLPGPILALLLVLFFDYSALTLRSASLPAVPGLTWAFGGLPTVGQYGPGNYVTAFFLFLTILAVLWLTVRYARWISTVYAVTTSRVIIQRGILSRDFDQIPILQVRGIDVHQTILDRIFHYGTIVISSEGGNRLTRLGNESWQGIPHPFEFQRIIEAATQNLARTNTVPMPIPVPAAPVVDTRVPGPA
jgi:hypothetical protein